MRICVIGNFSGRNAGDAAILGGLLKDITAAYGPVAYDVPTINPGFVRRQYPGYDIRPVGMLPWNLSLKILVRQPHAMRLMVWHADLAG